MHHRSCRILASTLLLAAATPALSHNVWVYPSATVATVGEDGRLLSRHAVTFGEMNPADKHAMSHRADAFRKLVAACFEAPV